MAARGFGGVVEVCLVDGISPALTSCLRSFASNKMGVIFEAADDCRLCCCSISSSAVSSSVCLGCFRDGVIGMGDGVVVIVVEDEGEFVGNESSVNGVGNEAADGGVGLLFPPPCPFASAFLTFGCSNSNFA